MPAQDRANRIRVLLADDSDTIRKVVRKLLEDDSAIQVVGEAANKTELFYLLRETSPDVLVVDLHLCSEPNAMAAIRKVQGLGLLVISALVGPESIALATNLGIQEVLEKADLPNTLVYAVKAAHSYSLRTAKTASAS